MRDEPALQTGAVPQTGNVLALDVGKARIGVAKGSFGSSLVFGRGVIERVYRDGRGYKRKRSRADIIDHIVDVMQQEDALVLVVGLPRRSDGDDSAQTRYVRDFVAALRAYNLEVVLEDERFTSTIATRQLVGSGLPKHKRQDKGRIDEGAAVLILESYLQRCTAETPAETPSEPTS